MNLPIDIVKNSDPIRFRWRQMVSNPVGPSVLQEYEGPLPNNVEDAVSSLIGITKQLALENEALKLKNKAK